MKFGSQGTECELAGMVIKDDRVRGQGTVCEWVQCISRRPMYTRLIEWNVRPSYHKRIEWEAKVL